MIMTTLEILARVLKTFERLGNTRLKLFVELQGRAGIEGIMGASCWGGEGTATSSVVIFTCLEFVELEGKILIELHDFDTVRK